MDRPTLPPLEWLNYHHLLYFWLVVREGGLSPASRRLRLSPSTVSAQIHRLEAALGEPLFSRGGRRLVPTDLGRVAFRYADEIFALGREFQDAVKGRPVGRPLRLVVGLADVVPKAVARRLLEPALRLPTPVRMTCREDKPERLLADLVTHDLDVVIADAPVPPSVRIRAFSHLLGECGLVFFVAGKLAQRRWGTFPGCLDGAPMLLPTDNASLRRALDQWFATRSVKPDVVAEFDDSALLRVFGQSGTGVFPVPAVVADELRGQAGTRMLGRTDEVRERFYALSVERRLKHPAVVAISDEARQRLFG